MTNTQKLRLRLSQVRQRLNEIASLEGDDFSDEIRAEAATLQTEFADLETRHQAAIVCESEAETRATEGPDAERRERLELRSRASLTNYLTAAIAGRQASGAEAELRDAAGVGDGIPIELWDVPSESQETRQDAPTGAPSTVGVNLDRIRPAVFAASIAGRLGVEMPRVESGSYASATITTSLSAASHAKGDAAEATAAAFRVSTVTPKRISARLGIRVEDVAAVGQKNFESILRENLSLVLSDALDDQIINGEGGNSGADLIGIFERLTDPSDPTAISDFDNFAAGHAAGIDGLWASTLKEVGARCRTRDDGAIGEDLPDRRELQGRAERRRLCDGEHGRTLDEYEDARPRERRSAGDPLPDGPLDDGRRCHADRRLPALERGVD